MYYLAVFAALAMPMCQSAIANVFDDNDNLDDGNVAAGIVSQKQDPKQNSLCISSG